MDFCINQVLATIEQSKNHQSITSINENMRERGYPKLSFHFITLRETIKKVALLVIEKQRKVLKLQASSGIFRNLSAYFMLHNFNNEVSISEFPVSVKCADVTPTFKKDDKIDKTVMRP